MKKTTFYLLSLISLVSFTTINAQVGVGTTTPEGALDLNPTVATNFGFNAPRVALTALNIQAPVANPKGAFAIPNGTIVWNTATAGTLPNNVSPGLYYWNGLKWISVAGSPGGLDWSIIGNGGIDGGVTGITGTTATQGTNFIGTYDNTNIDIRTNGLHAARVSSLGEFFIGALETVLPGDLMNGVSEGNATFPWAINGYTNQNGGGVYGSVTGGTTAFAAVQGEYSGTYASSAGVRGINFASVTVPGTSFSSPISGVNGTLPNTAPGTYSQANQFGVNGSSPSNTGRTVGGVIGLNFQSGVYGMLGYRRSNGLAYGALSSTAVGAGLTSKSASTDTSIGMGTQGGFLGAQIKGNQFGLITKGDVIGQYTDGSTVTTKGFAVISKDAKGNKATTYVPTSTTVDVSTKGTGKLVNGYAKISFDKNYSLLTSKDKPVIVTVSPMGETKGVYVTEVTTDGFIVKENGKGNSNASFLWIAIGEKNNADDMKMPAELLTKDFDSNLDSFLTIDEDVKQDQYEKGTSKAMWWNGKNIVFGNDAPDVETNGFKIKPTKAERFDPNVKRVVKENLRKAQIDAAVQAKAAVK